MKAVAQDPARVAVRRGPPLELVRQVKLADALSPVAPELDRLEASGVMLQEGLLWVIFDNLPHVAGIGSSLVPGRSVPVMVRQPGPAPGYEDIAHDEVTGQRFLLIESAAVPGSGFRPQIDEYDSHWRRISRRWVELDLEHPNKGLEGLTCIRRGGRQYLLALSEGNRNQGGRRGRRPGGGLVQVLERQGAAWVVLDRIHLPPGLPFTDYSGLSVRGQQIAVVSQQCSAIWIGHLDAASWQVTGGGQVHGFPRDRHGRLLYGTVEGVSWVDDQTVAAVSDRAKRHWPRRLRATAESVHLFALPAGTG
jgi:hypothetical protein